jgi:chromosome segregation ATPase
MIRGTDLIEKLSDQMEGYYSSAAEERQEIAGLEQKLAALTLKRTNLFLDFAEHEIATDDTKNLVRVLGDSALKVQEMIDHRRKRLGEIEAEIKQKSQQLEATKQTLKEAEERRTKAVEAEKAAFAEAEKLANADSAVVELEQKLAPVCAKRTTVERRLAEAKKNWEDKKGAYDNDAIFSYLRKRTESEKPGGSKGLFEKVDGWLAQQTGFTGSLTHYNELKELPTLLTGFLDKWKSEEQVLREQYGQARSRIIKAYKPREETEAISLKAKEALKQAVAQRDSALAEVQKLNTEHQLLLAQKDPDFLNAKNMLAEAIQKFGSAATQMPVMQQVQNEASKIGEEIDRLRTNVKAHRNRLQQLTEWTQRTAELKSNVEERNWNRRRVLFDDSVVSDSSIQQTVVNNLSLLALLSLWEQNHTIQQEVSHSYRHDNSWGSFGGGSSSSSSWGSSSSSSDSGSWSTSSSDSSSGSWSTSDSV